MTSVAKAMAGGRSRAAHFLGLWVMVGAPSVAAGCAAEVDEALGTAEATVSEPLKTGATVSLGWVSEESPQLPHCPAGYLADGAECSGSYCDDVRLRCRQSPVVVLPTRENPYVSRSTYWISEEEDRDWWVTCANDEAIDSIRCSGSYCDNVRLGCVKLNVGYSDADCYWSKWISEEQKNSALFSGTNEVLTGVACSGSYCDNMSFRVCRIPAAESSSLCRDRCGGVGATGTCYCDWACAQYGDCCADKKAYCG